MRAATALVGSLFLLAALAGCVQPAADLQPAAAAELGALPLVAHTAAGLVPLPVESAGVRGLVLDVGQEGGEPTIGVDSAGALYVTGGLARVLKSEDKGETWKDVSDRSKRRLDLDPYVWVDPSTDRIFSAPLYVVCSNLMWSDDGGATWEWNPLAGCGLPAHDHQSLVTGPPPEGVATEGYPNVVYYSYNSFRLDGTRVSASFDGGKTWGLDTKVADGDMCQVGLNGAPAVAPDGTVYVPMARCDGLLVGVSKDAGQTWTTRAINEAGILGNPRASLAEEPSYMGNPAATVDTEGNAYMAWPGADGRIVLSVSRDGGDTWSAPVRVTPPAVTTTAFVTAIASAPGRVAIGYLGTTADTSGWKTPSPQYAADDARWNVYLTTATDALADDPVFTTLQATPDDDPAQIGCIWLAGGANDCRNLGDFIDITERNGRPYLVYADGCDRCAKNTESRRGDLRVLVLDQGPSLDAPGELVAYAEEQLTRMAGHHAAARPPAPWRLLGRSG